jgi:hypothetical protein
MPIIDITSSRRGFIQSWHLKRLSITPTPEPPTAVPTKVLPTATSQPLCGSGNGTFYMVNRADADWVAIYEDIDSMRVLRPIQNGTRLEGTGNVVPRSGTDWLPICISNTGEEGFIRSDQAKKLR